MIVYRNVFNRTSTVEIDPEVFIQNPEKVCEAFELTESEIDSIKGIRSETNKQVRNDIKRDLLPAASMGSAGILTIDIDGISDYPELKTRVVNKLIVDGRAWIIAESVSDNIVAFFKFDCSVADYPFLYYKLWLELTLATGQTIDFLPDIQRLRYLSFGKVFYNNGRYAPVITDMLKVDKLPGINTTLTPTESRSIIYRSN